MVHGAGESRAGGARSVAHAPGPRRPAVCQRRSGLEPHLVGGRGRQPEPDVPGPARSGLRPALLAPEGARDPGRRRRSLRRRVRRHRQVAPDVPALARAGANGAVVPVSVDVTSPMTPANHVKTIYVVADKNRIPVVFRTTLGPEAGQAAVGATIRLGETGDVRAIVEQSDGTLLAVKREVKVTVGGCGG